MLVVAQERDWLKVRYAMVKQRVSCFAVGEYSVASATSLSLFFEWKFVEVSTYFHGSFDLLPWKLPPTSMEVDGRTWKLP